MVWVLHALLYTILRVIDWLKFFGSLVYDASNTTSVLTCTEIQSCCIGLYMKMRKFEFEVATLQSQVQ